MTAILPGKKLSRPDIELPTQVVSGIGALAGIAVFLAGAATAAGAVAGH